METQRICSSCQKPLALDVPLGLCPECLIKSGMDTATEPVNPSRASGFVPPPVEELRKLFPQLEILELIGQGGMGAVYKARQPALDRLVALKILPPGSADDAGFAERFNREARALARLNHPHIVAVHDFGQLHRQPYLVMEFVDGPNLRQVEQAGRLMPEQALEIVPQICEALQFAHNEGVVHRDIKPENILLDKKGRVKITDFGIAKIVGVPTGKTGLTGAKDLLGTPHYMAPEQVEKPALVDHRADIYSLGVVFYELLTGELPLGRFQPPSRKVHVDVRLDEVVLHALEKEPERRYQQASQLKTDVETIASGEAATMDHEAIARAQREVNAPANWLVATGILNWITIPVLILVAASLGREEIRHPFLWMIPVAALVLSGGMILAGLKMKRLEAYRLAVLGSGLAIFMSPGNIIGLPAGIWSLVVLYRREVQRAFGKGEAIRSHEAGRAPRPGPRQDRVRLRLAVGVGAGLLALILIILGANFLGIALPILRHAKQAPNLTLAGTVCDADTDEPIPGARVDDTRYGPDRLPQQAWTDASGRYELRTWYEEHTLSASAPGYEPDLQTLMTKVFGKEKTAQMNFRLHRIVTAPAFGRVTETILPFGAPCENHYLQFRSGRVFTVGRGPSTTAAQYDEDWQRVDQAGGADVSAVRLQEGVQFVGEGCIFSQDPGLNWEATSAAAVLRQLRHASWVHGVVEPKSKHFPALYLFRTAGGDSGIVQLLEVVAVETADPVRGLQGHGLKLRYRLVDAPPTPSAGANSMNDPVMWGQFDRLVVDSRQMTFEGQPTTWEGVAALLAAVPHRTNTVLEFAVSTDQVTVAQ